MYAYARFVVKTQRPLIIVARPEINKGNRHITHSLGFAPNSKWTIPRIRKGTNNNKNKKQNFSHLSISFAKISYYTKVIKIFGLLLKKQDDFAYETPMDSFP